MKTGQPFYQKLWFISLICCLALAGIIYFVKEKQGFKQKEGGTLYYNDDSNDEDDYDDDEYDYDATYQSSKPELEVTAQQLKADLTNDGSKAKSKYLNKVVTLTGYVGKVYLDDDYFILTATTSDSSSIEIKCYVDDKLESALSSLQTSQEVTIVGRIGLIKDNSYYLSVYSIN